VNNTTPPTLTLNTETETQAIAKQLLAATQESRSLWGQLRDQMRWDDKLLAWAMENPGLRVQLFRFIDCLPSLGSRREIASHLQEYLTDAKVELPAALKGLLNFSGADSIPGQLAAATVSTAVQTLAQKYIAGENIQQVLKTIEHLRKSKLTFTLDVLGEAVISEIEAKAYFQRYIDLIDQLGKAAQNWATVPQIDQAASEALPKAQVSVKLTAFYSQFDPLDPQGSRKRVSEQLRRLLAKAAEQQVALHFDMEQYSYKEITLAILKELLLEPEFQQRSDIGITLQAYLRDSYRDLQGLITWAQQRGTPVTVRLVKGAYWDQETILAAQKDWPQPVYNHKGDTDANFERMTELLLQNHGVLYAAIGSHNVRSQAKAIAVARALQVPPRALELQVLYGMADKLAHALVEQGQRVRVYCPYGELIPGMAYLIRRLLENTANSSFLKQSVTATAAETLLAAPETTAALDTGISAPAHSSSAVKFQPAKFQNAADTDFALAQERNLMAAAITQVGGQLGQTYWPWVNGQPLHTAATTASVNPCDPNQIVGHVGSTSIEQVEQALQAAKAAFPVWKRTPVAERAAILRRAADLISQQRHQLTAWMAYEVGKVVREGDVEISEAIDFCRYYAAEMERLEAGYQRDYPGETNRYHYQPRGIAVVISPWNFPAAIPLGMTVAALVTGNCTILKPAEPAAVIAAKLAAILVEAGMPAGVFQFIPGKGSLIGPYLTQHPDVHVIAFTGSQAVGCQIYESAAKLVPGQRHMKRVIAEMGGKNAIIVDQSADLDQAVVGVVKSAFGYSGQKCSACSRVIVLDAIYDQFVQRLLATTQSLQVGAAIAPSSQMGPVVSAAAQAQIQAYINKGEQEAHLALQMPVPATGYFISPTIFTHVAPDAVIAREEIFGPVLAVLRASSFDAALTLANNTDYALTGGVYSRTPSHLEKAKAEFAVGNLYINRGITGAIVDRQAFGGFKLSGVGSKAGGPDYLLQFLEPRVITENIQRQGFAPIAGVDD
jgi:RHH-type transcriptional regulator, proline utilization regulon repressor / proline dehydrogenase / delta 1-pyrroline-5-carboxylate dehydrogenase